ncbi:unnamed protein product [Spodoptera exigua]|nr:unnamed protein product [Spodoptera exigua]
MRIASFTWRRRLSAPPTEPSPPEASISEESEGAAFPRALPSAASRSAGSNRLPAALVEPFPLPLPRAAVGILGAGASCSLEDGSNLGRLKTPRSFLWRSAMLTPDNDESDSESDSFLLEARAHDASSASVIFASELTSLAFSSPTSPLKSHEYGGNKRSAQGEPPVPGPGTTICGTPNPRHVARQLVAQTPRQPSSIIVSSAVVVAFFVCWAPFHFQRLFFIYGTSSRHYHTINEYLFYVAGAFYYISATVNPILYNVMSHRYRIAFTETLCCGKVISKKNRYREHSSIRETMVNHTSDGTNLVRVRSEIQHKRNRLDRRSRRCSYYGTETTSLCSEKWRQETPKKMNSMLINDRNSVSSTLCNNNESQLLYSDFKIDGDVT